MNRLELKANIAVDDTGTVKGVAWPFGEPDRMGDLIEPAAFKGVKLPLPMLAFHDPASPIGVWEAAETTAKGLEVTGRLLVDHVARAREVQSLVKAGAVTGLSIGYVTKKSTFRKDGGRTIAALDLVEISLVTVPMHPRARVTGAKSGATAHAIAEALTRAATAYRATR